jgi:hypothetical protein
MRNGSFAQELPNIDYNILSGELTQYVNSSAVAAAWVQQNVFIAKRTEDISGTAPCEMTLDKLDSARACSPDGSTAYFFMVSQVLEPSFAWGDYSGTPGVSKVGEYGLDLYTMATAAEWVQNNYFNSSGYFPNVSPTDMVKDFTSEYDPLPNGYFINIPVMDADGLSEPDLYNQGGDYLDNEVSTCTVLLLGLCTDNLINRLFLLLKSWTSFRIFTTGHTLYLELILPGLCLIMYMNSRW